MSAPVSAADSPAQPPHGYPSRPGSRLGRPARLCGRPRRHTSGRVGGSVGSAPRFPSSGRGCPTGSRRGPTTCRPRPAGSQCRPERRWLAWPTGLAGCMRPPQTQRRPESPERTKILAFPKTVACPFPLKIARASKRPIPSGKIAQSIKYVKGSARSPCSLQYWPGRLLKNLLWRRGIHLCDAYECKEDSAVSVDDGAGLGGMLLPVSPHEIALSLAVHSLELRICTIRAGAEYL